MGRLTVSRWALAAICVVYFCGSAEASESEDLFRHLGSSGFQDAPFVDGEALTVNLSVSLINIAEADPATNTLDLVIWPQFYWNTQLKWSHIKDRSFSNLTHIRIPAKILWLPDVTIYNQVSASQNLLDESTIDNVVVNKNGEAVYIPSRRVRVSCDLTGLEASDGASCRIKFGSWMYTGDQLDLHHMNYGKEGPGFDLHDFSGASKYDVLHTMSVRNEVTYTCCPGQPFVDISYYVAIKKKTEETEGSFWGLF